MFNTISENLLWGSPSLPFRCFLEISTSCNLNCIMCRDTPSVEGAANHMGLEIAKTFCRQIGYTVPTIYPFGWGEPLVNPYFLEIIKDIRRANSNAYIAFNTNGQLLKKNVVYSLIDSGVDQIAISLDATSPELYEKIRRGASFSKLVKNLTNLNEIKKDTVSKKPQLALEFVVMKNNVEELPDIPAFAAEFGFKTIILEEVRNHPELLINNYAEHARTLNTFLKNATAYKLRVTGPFVAKHKHILFTNRTMWLRQNISEAKYRLISAARAPHKHIALTTSLRFAHSSYLKRHSNTNIIPTKGCAEPWTTIFIDTKGNVRPCCVMSESMGNIMEEPIAKIWHGDAFNSLRESIRTGHYSATCKACLKETRIR